MSHTQIQTFEMINHHLKNQFREREKQSTKPSYKRAKKLNYSVVIHSQLKRKYGKRRFEYSKKQNMDKCMKRGT